MPEPVATGTLASTPLPHLLIYLEQRRLSGTLAIWPDVVDESNPQGQDRILLLKGHPVAGRLIEPAASLREGMLRMFERSQAPYAFYESNLLGDDRLSGRVDPLSLITESLRSVGHEAVIAQVLSRFTAKVRVLPGIDLARYDFEPAEKALVELVQAEPNTVETLMACAPLPEEAARRVLYLLAITKAIGPFEEGETSAVGQAPAPRPAQPPPRAASGPVSAPVAPPARPASQAIAPAPPPQVSITTQPSAVPSRVPSGMPSGAPAGDSDTLQVPMDGGGEFHALDRLNSIPPPVDGLQAELGVRWQRIVAKGRLIENQNYFEMLDIPRDTLAADARTKFYELAKEWHPDRLPAQLAPLREYVQIIFSYMSEANATLGNEDERIKYLQTLREGGGTPRTDRLMQSILDSAMEYERVLVLSRKHDYDGALEVLQKILGVIKDEPDYHAMHSWLLMQKFQKAKDAPLSQMLASAEKAIELYPQHEKANLCKAQILRRMGKTELALAAFRKVVEINPNNIDAAREVRVATMRKSSSGVGKGKKKDDKASGLLGRFFKK